MNDDPGSPHLNGLDERPAQFAVHDVGQRRALQIIADTAEFLSGAGAADAG